MKPPRCLGLDKMDFINKAFSKKKIHRKSFKTKEEAMKFAEELKKKGIKKIRVEHIKWEEI